MNNKNCHYKIQSYESDKRFHLGCENSSLARMSVLYESNRVMQLHFALKQIGNVL